MSLAPTFNPPGTTTSEQPTGDCPVCGAIDVPLRERLGRRPNWVVGPHNQMRVRRGSDGRAEVYRSDRTCGGVDLKPEAGSATRPWQHKTTKSTSPERNSS